MSNEPRQSGANAIDGDLELLAMARLAFKGRLELVGADDWTKPTPCTEWNVGRLVSHVIGSDLRYRGLLDGGRADDFTRRMREEGGSTPMAGSDPVEDWARSGAALDAAFLRPGAMERVVDYPRGPLQGRELLENRIVDITIHTWDLARALDANDTLDERLVRRSLSARFFQGRVRGAAEPPDTDESPSGTARRQVRLLRASGRTPT